MRSVHTWRLRPAITRPIATHAKRRRGCSPQLNDLSPRTALLCNLLLAEAALTLGDPAAAADFAAEARRERRHDPAPTT